MMDSKASVTIINNDNNNQHRFENLTTTGFQEPSYSEFFLDSYEYFYRNIFKFFSNEKQRKEYFENEFQRDLSKMFQQINSFDINLILLISLLLTIGRYLMTKYAFQPLTYRCGIPETDAKKIPESMWKLLFYMFTWFSSSYYVFIIKRGEYFNDPTTLWSDYSIDNPINGFVYIIYIGELSFYIHSLYTTIMVDERRKDTATLMFHHIICVILVSISYCNKSHKCGLAVLILHDGCDILLEATKLIRYFKVQHGHTYESAEMFVNLGFCSFLFTWLTNRLYWFPKRVIYTISIWLEQKQQKQIAETGSNENLHVPFVTIIVVLLWIILALNFYWFTFAVRLLYKVATGQINELEDNREFKHTQPDDVDDDIIATTINNDQPQSQKLTEEEKRKFSIDSGVDLTSSTSLMESSLSASRSETNIINDVSATEFDDNKDDQSMDDESTLGVISENNLGSMSTPTIYNLRQRKKAMNFRVWK